MAFNQMIDKPAWSEELKGRRAYQKSFIPQAAEWTAYAYHNETRVQCCQYDCYSLNLKLREEW